MWDVVQNGREESPSASPFIPGNLNPRCRECGLCLRDDGENGNVWYTGQRKKVKIAAANFDGTFQGAPME